MGTPVCLKTYESLTKGGLLAVPALLQHPGKNPETLLENHTVVLISVGIQDDGVCNNALIHFTFMPTCHLVYNECI
jgi:hypothetical protein